MTTTQDILSKARESGRGFLSTRGLLLIVAAVGLLAGVMAAQSVLAPQVGQGLTQGGAMTPGASGTPNTPGSSSAASTTATGLGAPEAGASGGARVVMMVTVLIGLGLAFVLMRKRQLARGAGQAPTLSLVGQLRVGGRWQVALVKVPGKTLVLGATDKGLSLLSTLEESDVEAQAELARLDREHKEREAEATRSSTLERRERPEPRGADGGRQVYTDLPDLDDLVAPDDSVNVRRPASAGSPLNRPITRPGGEPFAKLLEELSQLPRPGAPTTVGPSQASGPIPTAQRDRMKTPEAQALRARLERYQGSTPN